MLRKVLNGFEEVVYFIPLCIVQFLEEQKFGGVVLHFEIYNMDHVGIIIGQYFFLLLLFQAIALLLLLVDFHIKARYYGLFLRFQDFFGCIVASLLAVVYLWKQILLARYQSFSSFL